MANQIDKLTPRQKRALTALLSAPDKKAAAELAGVGYRSLNRWLTDDLFTAELRRAESDIIAAAVRSLIADLAKNIKTMRTIRDNDQAAEAVRLRACQVIDQSLLKWRENDFENRLTALEKAVLNDH